LRADSAHTRCCSDAGLRRARHLRVALEQALHVGLQPGEERGVADEAVLDDLADAARQLAVRQRAERVHVNEHCAARPGSARPAVLYTHSVAITKQQHMLICFHMEVRDALERCNVALRAVTL